jgi:2-isopropylmalate synthase
VENDMAFEIPVPGAAGISPDRVRIFDTTLRDGEQSPGATMTSGEKLEIAQALSRLGVDVIEAGFPAASPDDLAAVRAIARRVGNEIPTGRPDRSPPIVAGLARATKGDLDKTWEAVREAARPRIHTFLATSDLHLEHKLRMRRDEVVARVREMVGYARALCADVEFSAEDAARSDRAFLAEVVAAAIEAGATTINVPDTVGYSTPEEFAAIIRGLRENVPGIERVILSVHCHDDLGMAAANTLAGVRAGARQVEVTINGIGERAGNTSLEEVVMALHTRRALFGVTTGIDTKQLVPTSRLVATTTGIFVPPNKAVVGANAFAHESGIHQDGMLKHQGTYEIMRPETVGATQTSLVLGKHSGRAALRARLVELGHPVDDGALDRAFAAFKSLAEKKKQVTDADLEALIVEATAPGEPEWILDGLQVACGTIGMPTATVRLRHRSGGESVHAATGTGPVDAAFRAIDAILAAATARASMPAPSDPPAIAGDHRNDGRRSDGGDGRQLLEFSIHSVTSGIDALGEVSVRIRDPHAPPANAQGAPRGGRIFHGHAADTDIVVASTKAYLAAINRLLATREIHDGRTISEAPEAGERA